jgi:division protein CdvB (Snf7/Vps24/ESCRT-III family)
MAPYSMKSLIWKYYNIQQILKLYQFRELSEILIEQRKLTFSMEKMAVFTQTVIITSLMYGY